MDYEEKIGTRLFVEAGSFTGNILENGRPIQWRWISYQKPVDFGEFSVCMIGPYEYLGSHSPDRMILIIPLFPVKRCDHPVT